MKTALLLSLVCVVGFVSAAATTDSAVPLLSRTLVELGDELRGVLAAQPYPTTARNAFMLHWLQQAIQLGSPDHALCNLAYKVLDSEEEEKTELAMENLFYALMLARSNGCTRPSESQVMRAAKNAGDALEFAVGEGENPEAATIGDLQQAVRAVFAVQQDDAQENEEIKKWLEGRHFHLIHAVEKVMELMESDGTFREKKDATEGSLDNTIVALDTLVYLHRLGAEVDWETLVVEPLIEQLETIFQRAKAVSKNMLAFHTDITNDLETTARMYTALGEFAALIHPIETITHTQVMGVARFLLQKATPRTISDIFWLSTGAISLNQAPFGSPISVVQPEGKIDTQVPESRIKFALLDTVGNILSNQFSVETVSGPAPLSPAKLVFDQQSKNWIIDVNPEEADVGISEVTLRVVDNSGRFIPIEGARFIVQVAGEITFIEAAIKIDSAIVSKKFPEKVQEVISVNFTQTFGVTFSAINKATKRPVLPHQAFVVLSSASKHVSVVAAASAPGTFSMTLNIEKLVAEFGNENGEYELHLYMGDSSAPKGQAWNLCRVSLKFQRGIAAAAPEVNSPLLQKLPEIAHQFQPPHSVVLKPIWFVFTVLAVLPLVVLVLALPIIGLNMRGTTVAGLAFWLCISSIAALLVLHWLTLTTVQAVSCVVVLLLPTTVCGVAALRQMYAERVAAK